MTTLEEAIDHATAAGPYFVVHRNHEVERELNVPPSAFTVLVADTTDEIGNALIISVTVSDDGKMAQAAVSAFSAGEEVEPNLLQVTESVLITHPI